MKWLLPILLLINIIYCNSIWFFVCLFVCFLARILCVLFVCMNKVDYKMYFKYSVFKRDSFYNCTRHDYSVNIQVSWHFHFIIIIIYNSDILYESIYKIYNMTNLKYYIYYLINSKSKEKAVRNAKNKMCLQHCSDVKKVVKAFDVENILCLQ